MTTAMSYIYGLLLAAEAIGLTVVYALWMPEASDPIGLWLGTLGLLSMTVMLIYSVARRSRALRRFARLSFWLHFHIFLGLQGALFAFFHCLPLLLRAQVYLMNPGVLNGIVVAIVIASGLFGRYLYAQVPKTLSGQHLAAKELDLALAECADVPAEVLTLCQSAPGATSFVGVIRADLSRRSALRSVRKMNLSAQVSAMALRRIQLERQKAVLSVANRWFRSWIFLHRPLAAVMYVLSVVHIALAVMFASDLRFW